MSYYKKSVENNVNSIRWDRTYNRVKEYVDYDDNIKELPKVVELNHSDVSKIVNELSEVQNDPEQEAEGNVLTPRMEWVQQKLEKMGLKYFDTRYKNDNHHSSYATVVPFISDFGKPATFYIASTNQYERNGEYSTDRLSGVVMGLALAAQFNKSEEYKNIVILFVNQHNSRSTAYLIEDMLQKRHVNVSAAVIAELCYFTGICSISEASMGSVSDIIFDKLVSKDRLQADPLGYSTLTHILSEFSYETVQFGSTIDEESYNILIDEGNEETPYKVEEQAKFCKTEVFINLCQLHYRHAIIMSSYSFYNELDTDFKH